MRHLQIGRGWRAGRSPGPHGGETGRGAISAPTSDLLESSRRADIGRLSESAISVIAGDEIVLADDAVAALHQVNQQVEHLRFDGNGLGTAAQLAPVGI